MRTLLLLPLLAACSTPAVPDRPTWYADVQPIVAEHCQSCHQPDNIGPFSLMTFEEAAPIADWIADVTASGEMPPWDAAETDECSMNHTFKDDARLDAVELGTLAAWADAGAPEGDPSTAAEVPAPAEVGLRDLSVTLDSGASHAMSGTDDDFWCFVFDPGLTETAYLNGLEVLPDNLAIVHHALVWVDPTQQSRALAGAENKYPCFGGGGVSGDLVGGWVPGAGGLEYPADSGAEVPAGSLFVMQIHYHGAGDLQEDATQLGLRWAEGTPPLAAQMSLQGNEGSAAGGLLAGPNDDHGIEFRIPADAQGHTETILVGLPPALPEVGIWLAAPHMHLAGVDMLIKLERGDPRPGEQASECLVHAPTYDFNWQRLYQYDEDDPYELPRVRGGDVLSLRCTYDNTASNPLLREGLDELGLDAPVDIGLGNGTLDEMCLAVLGVVYPR